MTKTRQTSPGERLYYWILDRYSRNHASDSWIESMAREFDTPDLERFLMRSTALMMLRRLISNARWYSEKRFPGDISAASDLYEKDYLLGTFGFNRKDRLFIRKFAFDSLDASKKSVSRGIFNSLKRKAKSIDQRCQLSGWEIDYLDENSECSFSLDHIWPRSLGGVSDEWNLQVTCRIWNERRKNIVEAADAHYEHFHVDTDWTANREDSFWKQLSARFRLAAILEGKFCCDVCGKSLDQIDSNVDFLLRNRYENYNIFNIQVACHEHRN